MKAHAYKQAGVDPRLINPFKRTIAAVAARTRLFPMRHGVEVFPDGTYRFVGKGDHVWGKPVIEGAGHKPGVAEWMRKNSGLKIPFYKYPAMDTVRMATNDLIVQGAMPVTLNDEVAACSSMWFSDMERAQDLAAGFLEACDSAGCALVGGESPAMKYLVRDDGPIGGAPLMSASVTGVIAPPDRRPRPEWMGVGDHILGAPSSGYHGNGYSLLIQEAMKIKEKFLKKLPSGTTFGEAAMIPTACYVYLVKALIAARVDIHGLQPITGDGVAKIAFDPREFTYRITWWPEVSELFLFMLELGISIEECLTTFNWGIGFVVFVPPHDVDAAIRAARAAGYPLYDLGVVEHGRRCTIFEPAGGLVLEPPGE